MFNMSTENVSKKSSPPTKKYESMTAGSR